MEQERESTTLDGSNDTSCGVPQAHYIEATLIKGRVDSRTDIDTFVHYADHAPTFCLTGVVRFRLVPQ